MRLSYFSIAASFTLSVLFFSPSIYAVGLNNGTSDGAAAGATFTPEFTTETAKQALVDLNRSETGYNVQVAAGRNQQISRILKDIVKLVNEAAMSIDITPSERSFFSEKSVHYEGILEEIKEKAGAKRRETKRAKLATAASLSNLPAPSTSIVDPPKSTVPLMNAPAGLPKSVPTMTTTTTTVTSTHAPTTSSPPVVESTEAILARLRASLGGTSGKIASLDSIKEKVLEPGGTDTAQRLVEMFSLLKSVDEPLESLVEPLNILVKKLVAAVVKLEDTVKKIPPEKAETEAALREIKKVITHLTLEFDNIARDPSLVQKLDRVKFARGLEARWKYAGISMTSHRKAIFDSIVPLERLVDWESVVGLDEIKAQIQLKLVLPMTQGHLKKRLKIKKEGMLLYGPPGTGKTYIANAAAKFVGGTFFKITASTIKDKYIGNSEKNVAALFDVAEQVAEETQKPSIIFIDEIDSLLSTRREESHLGGLQTEILTRMNEEKDGIVYVIGATNLPMQIDRAAWRRLNNRIYVGLPNVEARGALFRQLLSPAIELSHEQYAELVSHSENFSNDDIVEACDSVMNYSLSVAAKAKHFAIGEDGFYRPVEPCTVCSQNTSEPQCILCDSLRLDPHQIPAGKLGETPFSYEQVIDAVRRQTPSSSPQDIKKWEEIRDEIEARN